MGNTIETRVEGPILYGLAPEIVDRLLAEQISELSDYVRYEVITQLDSVLQNPTGVYVSKIRDQAINPYLHSVNDSAMVYGPWLEGTGSRNYPVTRFKGYHTFRIVRNRMAQKQKAIIAAFQARAVGRL